MPLIVSDFLNNTKEDFYINEIQSKFPSLNNNKYIDYQYVFVKANYSFYKIFFEIEVYIANNFFLPSDFLLLNVNSPSFKVEDLMLIKTQKIVDINIPNIQYDVCSIYKTEFSIDVSGDNFFNGTADKYFELDISFGLNPNSIKNDNGEIDINNFNQLINEISLSKVKVPFYHQNKILINKNDYYEHIVSIESDSRNKMNLIRNRLFIKLFDFEYANEPIRKLFNIYFDKTYNVTFKNVVLNLNYSINNYKKNAKLEFNSELNTSGKNILFELNNYETYYDEKKEEIIFQKGNNGIYFPFDTYGEYDINFTLLINNKPVNYEIINTFNYSSSSNNLNFIVENLSETLVNYEEIYI